MQTHQWMHRLCHLFRNFRMIDSLLWSISQSSDSMTRMNHLPLPTNSVVSPHREVKRYKRWCNEWSTAIQFEWIYDDPCTSTLYDNDWDGELVDNNRDVFINLLWVRLSESKRDEKSANHFEHNTKKLTRKGRVLTVRRWWVLPRNHLDVETHSNSKQSSSLLLNGKNQFSFFSELVGGGGDDDTTFPSGLS